MLKTTSKLVSASQLITPISLAGDVTISTGNLVIGTSGKGIDFSITSHPAGMTSELFADYEEGTWTPTVTASSGSITSYTATGKYTRIGRSVVLSFVVNFTNAGTGAGTIFIDGAPFNAAAAASDGGAGRESGNTGYTFAITFGTTSRLYVNKYDGGYPGLLNDKLPGTITYTV